MGAGTQTHLIFPRRAIPGVSWSPPLERAEAPQPTIEASREFASKLATRKAALEANPQPPPSPESWALSSPSTSTQTSAHPSPRSEASDSPVVEESAPAGSAEPASIGSLIQKFERANQADPHACKGPSPRLTELDRQPGSNVSKDTEDRGPSRPKWWQRLRRNSSKVASSQGRQEPEETQDISNAAPAELPLQAPSSPDHKKPYRNCAKVTGPAPIMTWYRACVSAPETPPAPFLSEDEAPPASARIAAHRAPPAATSSGETAAVDLLETGGQEAESPSAQGTGEPFQTIREILGGGCADPAAAGSCETATPAEHPRSGVEGAKTPPVRGKFNSAEPSETIRGGTSGSDPSGSTFPANESQSSMEERNTISAAVVVSPAKPGDASGSSCNSRYPGAPASSSEESAPAYRSENSREDTSASQGSLSAGEQEQVRGDPIDGSVTAAASAAASSDKANLKLKPQSGRDTDSAAPVMGTGSSEPVEMGGTIHRGGRAEASEAEAANLDIWLLPREPSTQSAQPGKGDAAVQMPDISPGTPEVTRETPAVRAVPVPAQRSSRLSRRNGAAPGEPAGQSPAQMSAADAASLASDGDEPKGDARKGEAGERLEAVRQLADQAARVQRRARRLVGGRARQQGVEELVKFQPGDASRKRASNVSPPPKRARRKDGQRSRTPSPEKVNQLLSDVDAVTEELQRRSAKVGAHVAFLDDLQSGIEAVRTRLRTPAASSSSDGGSPRQPAQCWPSPASQEQASQGPAAHDSPVAVRFTAQPFAEQPAAASSTAPTTLPARLARAEQSAASMRADDAQLAVAPLADALSEECLPERGPARVAGGAEASQLVVALPAGLVSEKCLRERGPDRVAEAAARAERAIAARRAAARDSAAQEGTCSPAALQRSALDLAQLSTTALTASMCLLVSVEQGVEVSARACDAICTSVLARVPLGSVLLGRGGDAARPQPSLAVRAVRGGIWIAYGAAGTVSGIGMGVLRASAPQSLTWRQ